MIMNVLIISLFSLVSINCIIEEYIPLEYFQLKTLVITNPCYRDKSILIRNKTLYKFDQNDFQWKRICVSKKVFNNQTAIVNSIDHLNNDLVLIINKNLFRTHDVMNLSIDNDIIYHLFRYSNIPILSDNIDYVFSTPCCKCLETMISYAFNDYIILANKDGNVILFHFKSMTMIYNFGNIFQDLTICQENQCKILYLGLSHSLASLLCIIQYDVEKAMIVHQSFIELNLTSSKTIPINFTGDSLYVTPSSIPNSYFLWDEKMIYYTSSSGYTLSEINLNGCQIDYLNNLNEDQLITYYKNLDIDYDNVTLVTKQMYCLNLTIDYIVSSNNEFFILNKNNEWLYGKESYFPSMIYLDKKCFINTQNQSIPQLDHQCLLSTDNQRLPCSDFVQSYCSYIRFEPLFDINQIDILEKNTQKSFQFIFETYTIIPIMITSTKSSFFNYSVNYTINHLNNGIIRILGTILVSITHQTNNNVLGSSLISFRLELIQYSYSCNQSFSFSFQIEVSCSPTSTLRVHEANEFNYWNDSDSLDDIDWIEQNLPSHILQHVSPVYLKYKQLHSILLNYEYCCCNHSCQSLNNNQSGLFIIYAIPLNKSHEIHAHYLINRTDSCTPMNQLIYRLWLRSILNTTVRKELFQIPYQGRSFYRTLLNMFSISNQSCLFFNISNPITMNQTINQASEKSLKFLLHIIAYKNQYSFCDLETFLLIEIEPIRPLVNNLRGYVFFLTLFLFILIFILFIHIYTYYKKQQRNKYLQYQRLNQLDAGQLHQWHDIAQYLQQNKHTHNYKIIQNYLIKSK